MAIDQVLFVKVRENMALSHQGRRNYVEGSHKTLLDKHVCFDAVVGAFSQYSEFRDKFRNIRCLYRNCF